MSDEIKETIKYFKHYVVDNLSLDAQDDFQKMLDYITNLQEENEILTNARYSIDRIELERRIEEAIEYITTEQLYTNYQWGKSQYIKILNDLLNILTGGDKA